MHSQISTQTAELVGLADTYGILTSTARKMSNPLIRSILMDLAGAIFSGGFAVLMMGTLQATIAPMSEGGYRYSTRLSGHSCDVR